MRWIGSAEPGRICRPVALVSGPDAAHDALIAVLRALQALGDQGRTVPHGTVPHGTVPHSTVPHGTAFSGTALEGTASRAFRRSVVLRA